MFEKEMSELLALGENFVKAFESIAQATTDETDKQVAIIRQAKESLAQTKETQGEFVRLAMTIASAMDDVAETMERNCDIADIVIDSVAEMDSQLFDEDDEVVEDEDEAVEDNE